MKLLDLINFRFGAISICDAFLGDPFKKKVLDKYDKDGHADWDDDDYLCAHLSLDDPGFKYGSALFEYDEDNVLSNITLLVEFEDEASRRQSNYGLLKKYLSKSPYFGRLDLLDDSFGGWNGINEISIWEYDNGLKMSLNSPWASDQVPGSDRNYAVLRTISALSRGEKDGWEDFVEKELAKKQ